MTVPFAPEYRDLSDNMPLLDRVARLTGGRVLPASPAGVNLFGQERLSFPTTSLPLNLPLMIAWLAVFWLDVATRRVALDLRAMWRQFFGKSSRADQSRQTLAQLRTRRQMVCVEIEERVEKEAQRQTAYRYEGGEEAESVELKMADTSVAKTKPPASASRTPAGEAAGQENSSFNRLLKAKRTARNRMDSGKSSEDGQDGQDRQL